MINHKILFFRVSVFINKGGEGSFGKKKFPNVQIAVM